MKKIIILVTIFLMDFVAGTEFDLFVPSFPELQQQFSLTPFLVEALLSVNFIGYCVSLFFVGTLSDRYGRKRLIVLGLVLFIVGSLCCLSTSSYYCLLIGRFLQGVGIAAPAILNFLIIADTYPLKKQQFFMAMLNGLMNMSAAVAPVLGSYITLYFHWQGNFIALLLLGVLTLVMTVCFIPQAILPACAVITASCGYAQLLQSKPLLLLMVNIIFMFVPYWIFVGMSPLLYMQDLGVSLAHFGYYQGVLALVFALGSVLFGLVMHRYAMKNLLLLSSKMYLLSIVSLVTVIFFGITNPLAITLVFMVFIISQVIPSNLLVPLCLNFMPHAKGRVNAILQGSRLIFAALSLQLTGYLYQGSFRVIGVVIVFFIAMALVTQRCVINHRELMQMT